MFCGAVDMLYLVDWRGRDREFEIAAFEGTISYVTLDLISFVGLQLRLSRPFKCGIFR